MPAVSEAMGFVCEETPLLWILRKEDDVMKLTWLGQAGYRLRAGNGMVVYIDPYLSDSLREEKGETYVRQVPIRPEDLAAHVDVLVLTHLHGDHTDFSTVDALVKHNPTMAVLAPLNVLNAFRARYAGVPLWYMLFDRGVEITLRDTRFIANFACHSDERPIGVVIEGDGKVICHTGDTMYHRQLLVELPRKADALLIPINGQGYNMNAVDAARLTRTLRPRTVYPMHWDMFAAYGCDVGEFIRQFEEAERTFIVVPKHYQEITL